MTEDQARAWIAAHHGDGAIDLIAAFVERVIAENAIQNLISPSTISTIWQRHVVDSAQLLAFDRAGEVWLDVGTGGGFPGMIVALLRPAPVVMVEPRKRRAAFLEACAKALGLAHVHVHASKVESWTEPAGVISARAVASLDLLFTAARQCAGADTRWILPRGRSATADLAIARGNWRGMFHVEHSVVEPDAGIIVAERVEHR